MTTIDFLENCTKYAKEYRIEAVESVWRNRHMNGLTEPPTLTHAVADALLADFINYIGLQMGVDYGLYTMDFEKP